MKRTALALAAGLLLAPQSPSLAQGVKPEDRNAAIKYSWAFYSIPQDLMQKVADLDMAKVTFEKDPAKQPKEYTDLVAAMEPYGSSLNQLIAASKLRKCDNEIEYEKGLYALLPHLGKTRQAARLLRVDARREMIQGDAAASAERIAAMVRMAGHIRTDGTLISSLVSAAIAIAAAQEAEAQAGSGLLTADARAVILEAFRGLGESDPFGLKRAVEGERTLALGWIKREFTGQDAGRRLVKMEFFIDQNPTGAAAQAAQTIAAMNGDQLALALDLLSPYYDQVVAAWDKPDGVAQIAALETRMKNGEFGPMGAVIGPALSKAKGSDDKARAEIRRAVDALGKK